LHPLIGRSRVGKRYGCLPADVQILENYYSRNNTSSPGIIPVPQPRNALIERIFSLP
jgi:hypothetical protein